MRKIYLSFIALLCSFLMSIAHAQVVNSPVPSAVTFLSGASGVTFVLENTNAGALILTDVDMYRDGAYGTANYTLWYSATSISGASTVNTPDWTLIASSTPATISTSGVYNIFTGLTFNIPASTTYRFCVVSSNAVHYGSAAPGNSSTGGGVNMYVGDYQLSSVNVGYSGSGANPTLGNNPRWFYGGVTVIPAAPCTAPPNAGTAQASNTNPCAGSPVDLSLTGNSFGTGQAYQWQSGPTATGPWTNIGTALTAPNYTITATATAHYRCNVTCGASTVASTPVQVTVPALFPAGTYTINSASPTAGSNFNNFTDAVSAISCGIAGPVVFNVAAASGPYNEQVTIPHINTTSAVNTVTFNGNGATLTYASANTNERAGIKLDGADYITINNLSVVPTGTYGFAIQLINDADNNTINNCTINNVTNSTSTGYAGIVISGSATSATTTGSNCDNNIISNNTVIGGYYGITCLGLASPGLVNNNQFINNTIQDMYYYGIYLYGNNNALVENNDISRPTRTTVQILYGIYLTTYTTNSKVSKNRVHNPQGGAPTGTTANYGIYLTGADATAGNENIISNNIIHFENGNGTQYALYNSSSDYALYYHNTISLENTSSPSGETRGLYQTTLATGIQFKNNIISITRGGSTAKYGIYKATATTLIDANNNIYNINSATTSTNNIGYSGGAIATLAAWQTNTSGDLSSLTVDPVFASPATGNYTPTSITVDNMGTPAGILTDFANNPRSLTIPDIGAYEFTAVPLSVSLINISAAPRNDDVQVTWSVTSEENISKYVVERSADGISFKEAGTVGDVANARHTNNYSFTDAGAKNAAKDNKLYYRLRIEEVNGTAEYSKIVPVKFDSDLSDRIKVYPNPFAGNIQVQLNTEDKNSEAIITLRNIMGKVVAQSTEQLQAGTNTLSVNGLSDLPSGIYELIIEWNQSRYVYKLSK